MAAPRLARSLRSLPLTTAINQTRPFTVSALRLSKDSSKDKDKDQLTNPPKGNPVISGRGPPAPPSADAANRKDNTHAATFMGTSKRMPEFAMNDKVVLVTGAARGLGLVTAEALLEAGATGTSHLSCRQTSNSAFV